MENKKEMRKWLDDLGLDHPLVIAGPCSAETEEQVLRIAHDLKDTDVNYYRAGIWKPRTRPGNFEGRCSWLKMVTTRKRRNGNENRNGGCQPCPRRIGIGARCRFVVGRCSIYG